LRNLRALSVRQPWAWLIVNGYKDVENRSRSTHHRGPILIHASKNTSLLDVAAQERIRRRYGVELPNSYELGGIIGVVDLADCRNRTGSVWHHRRSVGWVLKNPRRLKFRRCNGALGIFPPQF
jgi:hypothetical protein